MTDTVQVPLFELRDPGNLPAILAAAHQTLETHHGIRHVTLQPETLTTTPRVRSAYYRHPALNGFSKTLHNKIFGKA